MRKAQILRDTSLVDGVVTKYLHLGGYCNMLGGVNGQQRPVGAQGQFFLFEWMPRAKSLIWIPLPSHSCF